MSNDLFVCDSCDHVDRLSLAYPDHPTLNGVQLLRYSCTKCQGKPWHGYFEYQRYSPGYDLVVNRPTGIGLG